MTTVTATVTEGYTYSYDANGNFLITLERQNLAAKPTVTVALTSQVDTEDLVQDAVTADKLADAVADMLPGCTITVSDEDTDVVTVTVNMTDGKGEALSEVCAIELWVSDAALGALGTACSGAVAATTGTIVASHTAKTHLLCVTDSSGDLVLTFTEAGALTTYIQGIVGDKVIQGSQAMVWT